jgi:hypothetical protein
VQLLLDLYSDLSRLKKDRDRSRMYGSYKSYEEERKFGQRLNARGTR